MTAIAISQVRDHIDEQVQLKAWVDTIRDQKSMQFIVLRDSTGLVQVAHWKKGNLELAEAISSLTVESIVTVTGKVIANESVKLGGVEIQLETLDVLSLAEPMLPIDEDSAQDVSLDWRFLDLRRPKNRLIFDGRNMYQPKMLAKRGFEYYCVGRPPQEAASCGCGTPAGCCAEA